MKANRTRRGREASNYRRRKDKYQRVVLIWLLTIKSLNYKKTQMAGIITYVSILKLNVNGLNSPIKKHCLANWIKNDDLTILFTRDPYY
jgi:hypothetical protein